MSRRATHADFMKVDGAPAEAIEDLDKYFEGFQPPTVKEGKLMCSNCEKPLDGMLEAMGVGVAYRWGIAHGEANCSGCGWPARGMHYIKDREGKDLLTIRNFFLPYHPDFVESKS